MKFTKKHLFWIIPIIAIVGILIGYNIKDINSTNILPKGGSNTYSFDCLINLRYCQTLYNYETTAPSGNAILGNQISIGVYGYPEARCTKGELITTHYFTYNELKSCLIPK